jgi:hypothetical protein
MVGPLHIMSWHRNLDQKSWPLPHVQLQLALGFADGTKNHASPR